MTITPDSQSLQEECLETGHRETLFPAYSAYVTIKLDPVGSVAFMEDEEATSAAEKLSGKTYVGFVGVPQDGLRIGQIPIRPFEVHMLRPGLHSTDAEKFITSDMCLPVFPNTDHPSRAPIQPVPAIPWTNAYHATSEKVILRVRTALADETLATTLSKSERLRLMLACRLDDRYQWGAIAEASAENGPTYSVSVSSGAEEDSEEWEVPQGPPDTTPWVHMSYDLTSVQELCDPQDFFQEIEVVQQLLEGVRKRQAEKTAQAIENTRKIDEAAFGHPPSRSSSVTPWSLPEPTTATDAASTDGQSPQEDCTGADTRETLCPARSSYVTIKLDPLGSVAFMEDEEATSAAEKLFGKTYVGFVEGNQDGLHIGEIPIQSFEVRMLRSGLPLALPEKFITSDMCIPVFPNTGHSSRAPIQPIPAIPWANAYHAAFEHVILRVRVALVDETLATFLSKEERMRLALACALDDERRQDCADEAEAGDNPTSSESVSSGAEEDSVEWHWEITHDAPDTTPLVHMSYDLTGVQELCDPQDFFQELEFVQQLLKGARERQAEKTAQAIENARKIDEAAFGRAPSHPSSVIPAPLLEPTTASDAVSEPCPDLFPTVNPRPTLATVLGRWATRVVQAVHLHSESASRVPRTSRGKP